MEIAIGIISVFGLNILVQIVKNKIKPKFGDFGVHAFIFLIAFIGIAGYAVIQGNPVWAAIFTKAVMMLAAVITAYQVLLKKVFNSVSNPLD